MRLPYPVCLQAAVLCCLFAVGAQGEEGWREQKGEHFIVRYRVGDHAAPQVLQKAEECYRTIGARLGLTRFDGFWVWERRVTILLYRSRAEFAAQEQAPEWAAGKASLKARAIAGVSGNPDFLARVLPHEITHLIFREYLGFDGQAPLWLEEGLAQWMEEGRADEARREILSYAKNSRLLTVRALTAMDIRREGDSGMARAFYAQAVCLVGLLMEEGGAAFADFCRRLRMGSTLEDALRFTYPHSLRTIDIVEERWKQRVIEGAREMEK